MALVERARRATIRHRTSIASSIPLSPIPDRSLYPLSLWFQGKTANPDTARENANSGQKKRFLKYSKCD
ncbi:hypothetical protein DAPPUDRAFT_232798 [Daphnia pulex]|uniref:Uncharacterized protein n=1 Tax=Daphnia pulex TaxID=6669 RepID=E9FSD7_DAPPU|nr:hypothetical protein DAPPUDRAFT_232798 [Daphnia pulex]|eukprot:EFX89191.1 hypothetical protein DAPPUDRAFT_232798 [Daphnia pulex]